jgi:hypothetical protein
VEAPACRLPVPHGQLQVGNRRCDAVQRLLGVVGAAPVAGQAVLGGMVEHVGVGAGGGGLGLGELRPAGVPGAFGDGSFALGVGGGDRGVHDGDIVRGGCGRAPRRP